MVIDTIGTITSQKLLKALFDPGSTNTMISRQVLSKRAILWRLGNKQNVSTLLGTMKTSEMVKLCDLQLTEFDRNCRVVDGQKALIFNQKYRHS